MESTNIIDPTTNHYTLAHNIVTSHYADEEKDFSLNFRLYHRKKEEDKNFKTKIALAKELVDEAESHNIKASCYLFDTWYLSPKLIEKIESHDKDWISKLKANRRISVSNCSYSTSEYFKSLPKEAYREVKIKDNAGKLRKYYAFTKVVKVSKLGKRRIVFSYDNSQLEGDPLILVTNRKDWEAKKIVKTWLTRWTIETFYRDAKQHLGLEDCQLRKIKGIRRHWYLVFLAHSLLNLTASQSILIKKVQARLRTVGEKCRNASVQLLRSLVFWISKKLATKYHPELVFQLLFS